MPILLALLCVMVLLEGTITTIPLTLFVLILMATKAEKSTALTSAFFSGIILDILRVKTIGQASLVLVTFLFFIFLYENKYEINTLYFVSAATFVGTIVYGILLGVPAALLSACITTAIAAVCFLLINKFEKKTEKSRYSYL